MNTASCMPHTPEAKRCDELEQEARKPMNAASERADIWFRSTTSLLLQSGRRSWLMAAAKVSARLRIITFCYTTYTPDTRLYTLAAAYTSTRNSRTATTTYARGVGDGSRDWDDERESRDILTASQRSWIYFHYCLTSSFLDMKISLFGGNMRIWNC